MAPLTKALNRLQEKQETEEVRNSELGVRSGESIPHSALRTPNSTVVFSINFLRHDIVPLRIRRALIFVALGYLAANIFFLGVLLSIAASSRAEWKKVQAGLQGELSSSSELAALKQEMALMQQNAVKELEQLSPMIERKREEFPFGGRLAAIAKTLPARTWITGLSGDREGRRVSVQAIYLVNPENPYDNPTKKWIESLKADPAFRERLKRCDLGASSQKMQGKAEIYSFELAAEWER